MSGYQKPRVPACSPSGTTGASAKPQLPLKPGQLKGGEGNYVDNYPFLAHVKPRDDPKPTLPSRQPQADRRTPSRRAPPPPITEPEPEPEPPPPPSPSTVPPPPFSPPPPPLSRLTLDPQPTKGPSKTRKALTPQPKGLNTPTKGLPTPPKGLPTSTKGLPTPPNGLPTSTKGLPTPPKGLPTSTKGLPTPPKRLPTSPQGLPTPTKALPARSKTPPPPPTSPPPPEDDYDCDWEKDWGIDHHEGYEKMAKKADNANESEYTEEVGQYTLIDPKRMDPSLPSMITGDRMQAGSSSKTGSQIETENRDSGISSFQGSLSSASSSIRFETYAGAAPHEDPDEATEPSFSAVRLPASHKLSPFFRADSVTDSGPDRDISKVKYVPLPSGTSRSSQTDLKNADWFFPTADRDEAEKLLKYCDDGMFLVRPSAANPGAPYTLSQMQDGTVQHFRIYKQDRCYALNNKTRWFATLEELVGHYKGCVTEHNSMFLSGSPSKEKQDEVEQEYYAMFG